METHCPARTPAQSPTLVWWLRYPPLAGVYIVSGSLEAFHADPQPMSPPFLTEMETRAWWHAEAVKKDNGWMPGLEN
jgi:hypothetical protein